MENRKELITKFRSQVWQNKYASRTTLLAYAFLRDVPYIALERTINEDSFGEIGRNSFLVALAFGVADRICEAEFGKSYWDLRKEEKSSTILGNLIKPEEKSKLFSEKKNKIYNDIFNWMQDKYKESSEVAA